MNELPVLYSFRRCPYAMRARIALKYSDIKCLLREVDLKKKPETMLTASPKGTVPVLVFNDGIILEESIDIVRWAVNKNDPEGWNNITKDHQIQIESLVEQNDNLFVDILRKYKYSNRYPEVDFQETLNRSYKYFDSLERLLVTNQFLVTNHPTIADIALFPFIRQYAIIDEDGFRKLKYPKLIVWLDFFLNHPAYHAAMVKYEPWQTGPGEEF